MMDERTNVTMLDHDEDGMSDAARWAGAFLAGFKSAQTAGPTGGTSSAGSPSALRTSSMPSAGCDAPTSSCTCESWRYRDDLVFTHADGSLIHPQRLSRWFRQHCEAAGLPRIRLHDVRHTYASAGLAAATGWHEVKVISERLGHASVGITLDTYSHVLPSADENTAHTLARVILGV